MISRSAPWATLDEIAVLSEPARSNIAFLTCTRNSTKSGTSSSRTALAHRIIRAAPARRCTHNMSRCAPKTKVWENAALTVRVKRFFKDGVVVLTQWHPHRHQRSISRNGPMMPTCLCQVIHLSNTTKNVKKAQLLNRVFFRRQR